MIDGKIITQWVHHIPAITCDEGIQCYSTRIELFYFDDNFRGIAQWVLAFTTLITLWQSWQHFEHTIALYSLYATCRHLKKTNWPNAKPCAPNANPNQSNTNPNVVEYGLRWVRKCWVCIGDVDFLFVWIWYPTTRFLVEYRLKGWTHGEYRRKLSSK